jgi:hypothetical protein
MSLATRHQALACGIPGYWIHMGISQAKPGTGPRRPPPNPHLRPQSRVQQSAIINKPPTPCHQQPPAGALRMSDVCISAGGLYPIPWGARCVGPPPVRKCHQMPSKEHMQLGWVVRWVLSTPPGHPTAGRRCGRVVPVPASYYPCSFVLALRELGLRLGAKAPQTGPPVPSRPLSS